MAELPSAKAAADFLAGKQGALGDVVGTTLGRAALIGLGLYVVGGRGKSLTRNAIAGAVAIEAFVLLYLAQQAKR